MHSLPTDVLLQFLITFGRFEYALKRAGFLERKSYASPDWKRFGKELARLPDNSRKAVQDCGPYLQAEPPKQQVVVVGSLVWEDRAAADTPIETLLESVKTARNNLFHGGKFPEGPVNEPARDQRLLAESIAVLKAVLAQPHEPAKTVAQFYREDFAG